MNEFPKNLEYLMHKNNIDDTKLGELVDVNRTTVTRWRKGIRSPKLEKLPEIAHVFNVEPIDLVRKELTNPTITQITEVSIKLTSEAQHRVLSYAEHQYKEQESTVNEDTFNVTNIYNHKKENKENEENVIPFPIYGATGAGVGEELYDDVLYEEININVNDLPKDAEFGILVNGDSMEPIFDKGSYAFVSKQTQVFNNTIALVVLNNAALIKKVVFNDKTVKLVSINPYYDDIYVRDNDNFRVVGRIVI
ncbi:XRE family transcriptional regulator [Staphylococcus pseudoxylosus]|uniref:helix-turn-helix domain-containing protein n=1 Tax=Staphylococcus pseudoxylosus TaxID=2282419 RepID=UPI00384EC1F3